MALENRLQVARERAALTQGQVAATVGVPREMVSFWETGDRSPNLVRLKQLARLYRVNVGYLLGEEELDEREGRGVLYRGLPADHAKASLEVETWLDFLDDWADFLEGVGEGEVLAGARKPPRPLNEGYVDDVRRASKLATSVREHFDLGLDPLPDLNAFLDEIGVLVYRAPLGNLGGAAKEAEGRDGVSGAFYNHPRLGWSILVNTSVTSGRQTFTLAHELAHALYHYETGGVISREDEAKTDPKERFANAFAANFLVPAKSLREMVKRHGGSDALDPLRVLQLAHYFGVSYGMLLYRLKSDRLISEARRTEFADRSVQRMARQLGLPTDTFTKPDEHDVTGLERLPFSVLDTVKRAIETETLSPSQAARILSVDEMALQEALFAGEGELTAEEQEARNEYAFI